MIFWLKLNGTVSVPAPTDLFAEGKSPKLDKEQSEEFHTVVAKGLFACKRWRPDIHAAVAAHCICLKSPNQDDWDKLIQLLKFIYGTCNDKLVFF